MQIASLDVDRHALAVRLGDGAARILLDRLGARRTDQEIVFEADIVDDRLVERVAGAAHRARIEHASHGEHGDIGGAAADVDNHGAARLVNW